MSDYRPAAQAVTNALHLLCCSVRDNADQVEAATGISAAELTHLATLSEVMELRIAVRMINRELKERRDRSFRLSGG